VPSGEWGGKERVMRLGGWGFGEEMGSEMMDPERSLQESPSSSSVDIEAFVRSGRP
jgi:hypothetical protein